MNRIANYSGRVMCGASAIGTAVLCVALTASEESGPYTAHEWGTFTSVQGGDGVLLEWRPLESSDLPKFVHDWTKPVGNRQGQAGVSVAKGVMTSLQRMETPVIYFYSDKKQTVNVSVRFPRGVITEWYPQASQIGPSTAPVARWIEQVDDYARKAGAKPDFTLASLLPNSATAESRASWAGMEILPRNQDADLTETWPTHSSSSHYFSARDADSDYVRMRAIPASSGMAETEKFIFYRGVGSFTTPLFVTMSPDGMIALQNTGKDTISHLFLLDTQERSGRFRELKSLAPGEVLTASLSAGDPLRPRAALSKEIGQRIAQSLAKAGLYEKEAAAMVSTWQKSWFEEEGLRVLYLLPRAWTDRVLPLEMNPRPRELVRVMVGRAEVLAPELERRLSSALSKAIGGSATADQEVLVLLKKLGRFAEPALNLATKESTDEIRAEAQRYLQLAAAGGSRAQAKQTYRQPEPGVAN